VALYRVFAHEPELRARIIFPNCQFGKRDCDRTIPEWRVAGSLYVVEISPRYIHGGTIDLCDRAADPQIFWKSSPDRTRGPRASSLNSNTNCLDFEGAYRREYVSKTSSLVGSLFQSNPCPATILGDELDAGLFEGNP
jgi:hypothetical protein